MSYRLVVKKPLELLSAILDCFSGADLSFEGDLSACSFERIEGKRTEPLEPFVRNTIFPKQDFVILPITPESTAVLRTEILPRVGLRQRVAHVLIGQDNELLFWAYDWFDKDCVGMVDSVPTELLQKLKEASALADYTLIEHHMEGPATG